MPSGIPDSPSKKTNHREHGVKVGILSVFFYTPKSFSVNLTVAIKYQFCSEEVKKKGLPATPYSTLPWPAMCKEESTVCEIHIWLQHIKFCRHCKAFFFASSLRFMQR
jgi:hypothetical protein